MSHITDHYTFRVHWSPEDAEYVALCSELPSLSYLAATLVDALTGIRDLASDVVDDLQATGETVPEPLSTRAYSGQFRVRIPPKLHRELAIEAAEQGISLNRLASDRLARSC